MICFCESCGKRSAKGRGFKAWQDLRVTPAGRLTPAGTTWVLCPPCAKRLDELIENAVTGGELVPDKRRGVVGY